MELNQLEWKEILKVLTHCEKLKPLSWIEFCEILDLVNEALDELKTGEGSDVKTT